MRFRQLRWCPQSMMGGHSRASPGTLIPTLRSSLAGQGHGIERAGWKIRLSNHMQIEREDEPIVPLSASCFSLASLVSVLHRKGIFNVHGRQGMSGIVSSQDLSYCLFSWGLIERADPNRQCLCFPSLRFRFLFGRLWSLWARHRPLVFFICQKQWSLSDEACRVY